MPILNSKNRNPFLSRRAKTEAAFFDLMKPCDSLNQVAFHRTISTEQRRADRGHKSFLLMLLDIGERAISQDTELILRKIQSVLRLNLRETDIVGWYKEGCVVGVIFTEIPSNSPISVPAILTTRVREILSRLLFQEFQHIDVSFHLGPGDEQLDGDSQSAGLPVCCVESTPGGRPQDSAVARSQ